jgi:hypothetical protein
MKKGGWVKAPSGEGTPLYTPRNLISQIYIWLIFWFAVSTFLIFRNFSWSKNGFFHLTFGLLNIFTCNQKTKGAEDRCGVVPTFFAQWLTMVWPLCTMARKVHFLQVAQNPHMTYQNTSTHRGEFNGTTYDRQFI